MKLVFSLLLLMPFMAKSQISTYNLPPKVFYTNATITLKDFTKYECKNMHIKPDSVLFTNAHSGLEERVPLSTIDYIRVQEGNEGLKWCGYGALLMGLIAVVDITSYPQFQYSGEFVIGFTLAGAVVGGLIGLAIPKWKTYYLNY
jgi:hypothetical protein